MQQTFGFFTENPIITCSFILFLCLVYKYVVFPYILLAKMKKSLTGRYIFTSYPFRPYGFSFIQTIIQDFKQYGDSFYTRKHKFSKSDLTLGTLRDHLLIGLINKELVRDFAERQKEGCYKKSGGMHFRSFKQILGDGLLLSQSEEWKYKRKVMSSLFNYELIKQKFSMIVSISKEFCQQAKKEKTQDGMYLIDVNKLFQKIFGNVVIRCFFGDIKLNTIDGKNPFEFLSGLIQKIALRNLRISSFLFGKFMMKIGARKIDRQINRQIDLFREYSKKTIDQIIQFVEKNPDQKDSEGLIVKLLRQKRLVPDSTFKEKIQKGLYTYEDLNNEMCTFFFAGTDTTSNAVASLIFQLIEHKTIEEKLRKQIKEVIDDNIDNLNLDNLKKMPYLRYVQSQILRIYPSVPQIISREALVDHKIGDIMIQKGTLLAVDIVSHHYNSAVFENPHDFVPERWQKLQNSANISQDFFPFSVGQRICMGQQLALTESKVALVIFLLFFKNGVQIEPPRYKLGLTYGPEKSFVKFESK